MKLVILDRDGVINQDREDFVKNAEEWVALPKSADAVALMNQLGYTVAVATNQSGLGRKIFTMSDLNAMHSKMYRLMQQSGAEISGIWFCPHTAEDGCACRKPKSGMIEDILARFGAKVTETFMVGDSLRDLQAIDALGGKPVLVLTGKGKKTLSQQEDELPAHTIICEDLWAFAQTLEYGRK